MQMLNKSIYLITSCLKERGVPSLLVSIYYRGGNNG